MIFKKNPQKYKYNKQFIYLHPKQNNHTKMSNINSTRYNWVDWCKSIAIFLVIWGHLPMHSIAISIIYSFHMPLFFLISGYLYKPQKTAKEEFKKNFKTLFVPYLIYQLIFYPYWMVRESLVFHQSFTIYDSIIRPIIQSLASNAINGPTWFIYCLLSFKIYAYCIQKNNHCLFQLHVLVAYSQYSYASG